MDGDGGGAYVSDREAYSETDEILIRDMARAMVSVGKGKRADLVAQAALDSLLSIWGWCGVTYEQANAVLTAQAASCAS